MEIKQEDLKTILTQSLLYCCKKKGEWVDCKMAVMGQNEVTKGNTKNGKGKRRLPSQQYTMSLWKTIEHAIKEASRRTSPSSSIYSLTLLTVLHFLLSFSFFRCRGHMCKRHGPKFNKKLKSGPTCQTTIVCLKPLSYLQVQRID